MKLGEETQKRIDKLYKKRSHVELTIGILKDGEKEIVHWGPDRTIKEGELLIYPVGSICKPFTASLLAKYVSEGKLDLSKPINTYLRLYGIALHAVYGAAAVFSYESAGRTSAQESFPRESR